MKNLTIFEVTKRQAEQIERSRNAEAFSFTTRQNGDGSEPCYVVYFERQVVAVFPINDPTSPDAREYAARFVDSMNGYYARRLRELTQ